MVPEGIKFAFYSKLTGVNCTKIKFPTSHAHMNTNGAAQQRECKFLDASLKTASWDGTIILASNNIFCQVGVL